MDGEISNVLFLIIVLFFSNCIIPIFCSTGVYVHLPKRIKEGKSDGFVDVFMKHACHPVEYDRSEERYKGLAEKILENSNWNDK